MQFFRGNICRKFPNMLKHNHEMIPIHLHGICVQFPGRPSLLPFENGTWAGNKRIEPKSEHSFDKSQAMSINSRAAGGDKDEDEDGNEDCYEIPRTRGKVRGGVGGGGGKTLQTDLHISLPCLLKPTSSPYFRGCSFLFTSSTGRAVGRTVGRSPSGL